MTVRQGDITGFDDAEVLDVEETEDTEVDNSHTETKATQTCPLKTRGAYTLRV